MTSFHRKLRTTSARGALLLACAAPFAASCSDETKPRGQVMLAISSDLAITKDMNQVGVQVFDSDDNIISSQDLDILPVSNGYALPGTLALVPPNSGGQTLRVVVTAKHTVGDQPVARIVRTAIVTVPNDRIALLRMPLHWLCSEKTDCLEKESCKAGVCADATTDSDELPDYAPPLVFGGGSAEGVGSYCLDAQGCFADTRMLKPNKTDCTVALPANADRTQLNVALVLPPQSDGHCLAGDDGICYVPLDSDPEEGFAIVGDRIQLPLAACTRPSVAGISVSTKCRTKDLSVPVCGPWTGWDMGPSAEPGTAGAGGSPDIAPNGGSAGKSASADDSGAGGDGGAAGSPAQAMCPVTAELAPAYYYVLVDTSADMTSSLPLVRQALSQFGQAQASSGVSFALQLTQAACQGNYSKPTLDFTPLPEAVSKLPQQFTASAQKQVQLDDALTQTVATLADVPGPVSRTLVVITAGVDQGCSSLTDVMHQALADGLAEGVSVRPILITGTPDQANVSSGLMTQGTARPVSVAAADQQGLLSALNTFRDAIVPCTYRAPGGGTYSVQLAPADGASSTFLPQVSSSTQCATSSGYYKAGDTFTLCPTACTSKGTREVITDTCQITAPADASCPGSLPLSGSPCVSGSASGCTYTDETCRCNANQVWQCVATK